MLSLSAQQVSDSAVAAAVDKVFRHGAYARLTYMQRLLGWIWEQLLRVVAWWVRGYRALEASPVLFWLTFSAAVLLVLAMAGRAVWLWRLHRLDVARGATWARGEAGPQWRDPWAAAQQLAAAGDYTTAAHALYAALLESAARTNAVTLHPSKTVGDYVRELRARSSSLFVRFREFARSYEIVIYGVGTCDAARYQRLLALALPVVQPND